MARLTVAELKAAIATYVAANKLAQGFTADYNLSGILNKIGKIYTIDQKMIDKMSMFDGEFLDYGKTVEEWAADLILPNDVATAEDVEVVKSHYGTNRPTKYSYKLGDKVFANSYKIDDLEAGVHNASQLSDFLMAEQRRMTNSVMAYRYAAKRQLLGRLADATAAAMNDTDATLWAANTAASVIGTRYKNSSTGTKWAVLVKPYATTDNKTFDQAVAAGFLVQYDNSTTIAAPSTTETGEAFIKKLKEIIEKASDMSEGHSLSGNTLGVTTGMTLFIKQGYMPSLEVDTLAGAFNPEKLGTDANIIVLPDFGTMTDTSVYAVLIDNRAIRLFPTNERAGEFRNEYKGFTNLFKHFDATCHYSYNAFCHVFKAPQA